jgi:MFS family permease
VSAISDLAPPARRGEAMSLFSLAPYAGMAVGPALGEALLGDLAGEASDFRAAWLVAVLCAGLAALAALRVPETRASANGSVGGRLVHRAAILPGLVLLTSWWSFTAFLAFMPLHAREVGLPDSRLVFVVFAAIMLTIRSAGARIPDVPSDRGARRAPRSLSSPSA